MKYSKLPDIPNYPALLYCCSYSGKSDVNISYVRVHSSARELFLLTRICCHAPPLVVPLDEARITTRPGAPP